MKKSISIVSFVLLGIIVATIYSCEEPAKETCQQDEICEAKSVTACCTDDVCVYKYDGKEYTEDEVGQLAIDMGCVNAIAYKSATHEDGLLELISRLKVLMQGVQDQK